MSNPDQRDGYSSDVQGFTKAYGSYNRYKRTLKKIYQDTLELYTGNPCGLQAREYLGLEEKKFTSSEDMLLQNTIHNPLGFVILGQTYKAKCLFANKLLGQEILPVSSCTWIDRAQMTTFKHGLRPQVAISLEDNLIIIEPRVHSSANEEVINWPQEFSLLEDDLERIEGGVVEITLHHPILKGCQVIISHGEESLSCVLSDESSNIMRGDLCTNGISPLFIYVFEKDWICAKEAENLNDFLSQYPDNAMAFSMQNCCDEVENHPPECVQDDMNGGCAHCDQPLTPNSDENALPRSSRLTEAMLPIDFNAPQGQEDDLLSPTSPIDFNAPHGQEDDLLSPTQHGIRNSTSNSPPSIERHVKRSRLSTDGEVSVTGAMDSCVEHGDLSPNLKKLVHDLSVIGYNFACTCKGVRTRQLYKSGGTSDSDRNSCLEEVATRPNSCSQTNPTYVALNLEVFNDTRLQKFPPNSIFIFDQQHDKLQARIISFTRSIAKYYLARAAKVLHRLHSLILDCSIRSAFQMSRDLMITPRRVEYAKQQEKQLYTQLVDISSRKQSEIQELINGMKVSLRENILNAAESYSVPDEELSFRQVSLVKREIQDLVLHHIKVATAERLYSSIQVLKESYIGTLSRCLECLESSAEKEVNVDTADTTSKNLKEILHAAYNVELNIQSSLSLARIMIDRLRQLLPNLPWHEPPIMDAAWRRNVASNVLASLDDCRLAKSICSQFRVRLDQSHSAFNVSLRQLETAQFYRLAYTEEKRHKVVKTVAPHLARLALESTSMIDRVLFGMPKMGPQIGRGMYGVVYQCEQWSSLGPCAVKSVAPTDEEHTNDLSLEFYYTRSLPDHPRVVQILGSIVDQSYVGGTGPPAVLLIMERMHCDLHKSLIRGLDECSRMQIAVDVVEGIRFLHSQGLVHRDIKPKNVLLDRRNRAKISDLGFCKPGAMMSGSIVGTPVHMPPELFTGKYDCSVDVYAFGILFWYLCAGVTSLPRNFEACTTKDHLWNAVRKGVRPERLPEFTDDCWNVMRACWHSDPQQRPLLGKIQPCLTVILEKVKNRDFPESNPTLA